jgi:hypothetical protein
MLKSVHFVFFHHFLVSQNSIHGKHNATLASQVLHFITSSFAKSHIKGIHLTQRRWPLCVTIQFNAWHNVSWAFVAQLWQVCNENRGNCSMWHSLTSISNFYDFYIIYANKNPLKHMSKSKIFEGLCTLYAKGVFGVEWIGFCFDYFFLNILVLE